MFHGTVVGAAILDFFATGVFLDDLEVDAFLFGIVTIIALTDFDLPGWNTGRRLVVLRLLLGWSLLRELGLVVRAAEACFAGAGSLLCCARGAVVRESQFALRVCVADLLRCARGTDVLR